MGSTTFEIRTIYTVYDNKDNVLWTKDHFNFKGDVNDICDNLQNTFIYGCWMGDDTKEWVSENLTGDYFIVTVETEKRSSEEIINCETLILLNEETDVMALRLGCV